LTLLPETNLADALRMAERLCTFFQGNALDTEAGPVRVTVSIGLAEIRESDLSFDVLQVRADQKLYEAKQAGRAKWMS
jgi:diguanylate cyclase (GGDEF)-like protein